MFTKTFGLAVALAAACAQPLSFEVASIKPATPCCSPGQWRGNKIGPDRVDFQYATLWDCIGYAYGVKSNYQVSGPEWMKVARFDIVAKAPTGAGRDQLPAMMRALLEERFRLQAHQENREIDGYALVVGKDGAKLHDAAPDSGDGKGGALIDMSGTPEGAQRLNFKGAGMKSLLNTLSGMLGRPVVDETGLAGRYDFVLQWTREPGETDEGGLSEAVQRLGLKCEPRKLRLDVVVVDHAEKTPTEN